MNRSLPIDESLDLPVTTVFERAAEQAGEVQFLTSRSLPESFTYREFYDAARDMARHLIARGVRPGDRVGIVAENRPRWCVAYLAILLAGGVVVPIDVHLPAKNICVLLRDSGAGLLFVSRSERTPLIETLHAELPNVARLWLDDDGTDGYRALTTPIEAPLPPPRFGDDLLAIIYTSGTTGDPKGVILSHRNVRGEMVGVERSLRLTPSDVLLMFLPLNHVLAQLGSFVLAAPFQIRVVHTEVKRGEDLVNAVREEGVTVLLAVPLLYHLMYERIDAAIEARGWFARTLARRLLALNRFTRLRLRLNLGRRLFGTVHRMFGPQLRALYSGGAMLDPAVQRGFHALGIDLGQGYGLTETTGCAVLTPIDDIVLGTVGRAVAGVEVRIDQPQPDGVGEVLLRGPLITRGYFQRDAESASLFKDEWLRTGDLGRLDARGELHITGRIKEVIVLGNGKNIYPDEIEAHYAQSPLILELCVMGQRRDGGHDQTEKLHAVIVPDFDELKRRGVNSVRVAIHDVVQSLSQSIPAWQRLLSFDISSEPLPRTPTRKLQRFKVAETLAIAQLTRPSADADQPTSEPAPLPSDPTTQKVAALLRKRIGRDEPLGADASLELDLGLDSLNRMELLLSVEQAFGVKVDEEVAARILTVTDLIDAVRDAGGDPTSTATPIRPWRDVVESASSADIPGWLTTEKGFFARCFFNVATASARVLGRFVYRVEWSGAEHLPNQGGFLICPNHGSFLDGPVLISFLPAEMRKRAFAVGAPMHISGGFRSWFSRALNILPIDSDRHVRESLRTSAALLKDGRILVIFPEGSRSYDGELAELRDGAAVLATELEIPIIPCAIVGAFEAWPRQQRFPRAGKISVRFAPPLLSATSSDPDQREDANHLSARLRRELIRLGVTPSVADESAESSQ